MSKYALYAWRPEQLDPREHSLNKSQILQHLSELTPRPPSDNRVFIDLALAIEHWAQNQRQTDVFDRVTIKAYDHLADHYRSTPLSHFVLHHLPSINFDSFYYTVITAATRLGLIIHSDIDNGTYYPDHSSVPAFLMSRLNTLKLKQPAHLIVTDIIDHIDIIDPAQVLTDKDIDYSHQSMQALTDSDADMTLAARMEAGRRNESTSLSNSTAVSKTNSKTTEIQRRSHLNEALALAAKGLSQPSLSKRHLPLSIDDTELLAQLKLMIETKLHLLNQQLLQRPAHKIFFDIQKRSGALGWDVSFVWNDSQVVITFLLERSYTNTDVKLDTVFKIIPPSHYKDEDFQQLFNGANSLNILYKSKLFIEASLKDIHQYLSMTATHQPGLPPRAILSTLEGLGQSIDQDIDFIQTIFKGYSSFYQLFDAIYQEANHPLHEFYWGSAESKPLAWSRFSRRHNMFLTLARLLQHPELPKMIADQRPLLLAYYDQHSDMMPIMIDLKAQFLRMCDKLMQGYHPK